MGLLADNSFGDTRSGGLAGPMGLLLIIVLGVVTVLLIRNMSKRIKRLPSAFDGAPDQPEDGRPEDGSVRSEAVPQARSGDPDVIEEAGPPRENLA
jgi:hypothetical protein